MLAFGLTTAVMALARGPIVVAIWVAIWLLAWKQGEHDPPGLRFNNLYLGFALLYPPTAEAFTTLHEYAVVLAFWLAAALYFRKLELKATWRAATPVRFLVIAWVGWGLLAYVPVLATWLMSEAVGIRGWNLFGVQAETTMLKVAAPMILAVFAMLIPLGALRAPRDFRRVAHWVLGVTGLIVVASAVQAVLGMQLVATTYVAEENRLVGITNADPNYYGRLLLLPTLLGVGWMMRRREQAERPPVWVSLVVVGAMGSLLMTLSRTTYASVAVGILALALLNLKQKRTVPIVGTVLVVIVVTAVMFNFAARFSGDTQRGSLDTLTGRLTLYEDVLQILRENPWFGARPGGYVYALYDIYQIRLNRRFAIEDMQINSPHNMVLAVAAEFGVPMGLTLAAALAIAATYGLSALRIAKTVRHVPGAAALDAFAKVSVAGACAYFIHGLTEIVPPEYVFWLLGTSIATWICARTLQEQVRAGAIRQQVRAR